MPQHLPTVVLTVLLLLRVATSATDEVEEDNSKYSAAQEPELAALAEHFLALREQMLQHGLGDESLPTLMRRRRQMEGMGNMAGQAMEAGAGMAGQAMEAGSKVMQMAKKAVNKVKEIAGKAKDLAKNVLDRAGGAMKQGVDTMQNAGQAMSMG